MRAVVRTLIGILLIGWLCSGSCTVKATTHHDLEVDDPTHAEASRHSEPRARFYVLVQEREAGGRSDLRIERLR